MSCVYRRIGVGLYLMGFNVFSVASSGVVGCYVGGFWGCLPSS